jgi:hypothetical protein
MFLLYRSPCRAVDKRRTKGYCFVQCYVSLDEWRYRQIDDVLRLLQIRRTGRDATTSDCKRTKHRTRYQNRQNQITGRDMDDRYSVVIGKGAATRGCAFRCWGSDVAHRRLPLPAGKGCTDLDGGAGYPATGLPADRNHQMSHVGRVLRLGGMRLLDERAPAVRWVVNTAHEADRLCLLSTVRQAGSRSVSQCALSSRIAKGQRQAGSWPSHGMSLKVLDDSPAQARHRTASAGSEVVRA